MTATDNRIGFTDRVALSAKLWDASDAFAIEATLWTGQPQKDCQRAARQLAATARRILSGAISVAEAEAFTEASREALGRVAGARRLRDAIAARRARHGDA